MKIPIPCLIAIILLSVAAAAQAETLTVNSAADAGGSCPGATCTLRQAILSAASGDTINFAAGIATINLTTDELLIDKSLTIRGPGANLLSVQRSAAGSTPVFRVFNIAFAAVNVTLSGLTIANGIDPGSGGGIFNTSTSTVNVSNCTLIGNQATFGVGGGIANNSSGGAINVTNCTLSGNAAAFGGGILNNHGTMTITNSTISGNSTGNDGGGIYNFDTLTIINSTVSGNSATAGGSSSGGGVYNDLGTGATLNVRNSIIAKNTASVAPDFKGTLASQGYNLIGNTSGTTITGTTTGNQLGVDPKLGPLQDNGGPTFTHALLSGSPAIEAGESSGSNTDQRGFTRPVNTPAITNATGGDGSDIGAYEVQADQLPGCGNTVVTNNNDSGPGSLRSIFANACDGETITFAPSVVSPIILTSSELLINKAMTISGPGANLLRVQRAPVTSTNFRIFHITSGGFNTISGLTIANGNPDDVGGGIYNQFGSSLTVERCVISGNSAGSVGGGGIANIGATTTIINTTISANSTSTAGGGIANAFGTVTITSSTISANSATGSGTDGGGGIFNGSSGGLNLTNSTITNNSSSNFGGCAGVQNPSGSVNARNTIIALNTSTTGFGFPDFKGTLTSQGFNFIGNSVGATITPAQFTDQIGTGASPKDPLLGPLQNNGGQTKTHALLSGSTAIDKGDSGGSSTDQRGYTRPADLPGITNVTGGDASDIGAFEVPATVLANISTRLRVETGDNVLIGGIIVTGTQNKKVIVRAIGPSLPFADKLANPILELFGPSGLIESNDNWVDSANKQAIIDSTIPPTNDLESAIVRSVAPGNYTAIMRGVSGGTGIGVVEVYDLDPAVNSKLANIATRGLVQTGDNVLIAGTIVVGQVPAKVIVRAIGPSLSVPGKLADPTLELHDASGTTLAANDNWKTRPDGSSQEAEVTATTIPPTNDLESAIVATLPANNAQYTAIVRGAGGTTGIAVVEVYALD
jgi:CSLREA domain-containing protein